MGMLDRFKKTPEGNDDQSKAEMDAMFAKFGEIIDERLKPVNESVSGLKTEWETIKAEATKTPTVDTRPRDENGNVRDLTDAEKQTRLNIALAEQNVQNAARFIERDVLDTLPKDFADLKPQIAQMFRETPVARKAQPDYAEYCQNCADLAIAREARKGGLRRNAETKEFFLEDKSSGSNEPDSILNDQALTWHDGTGRVMTAREQLAKLGIDAKKFEERAKSGVV
jgi:hypothetical protein